MREFIKKSPVLVGSLLAGAVVLTGAIGFIGSRRAAPDHAVFATRAFYTTDDGVTLFEDDVNLVPPFDHDGRPAVRAHVFSCGKGTHQWVQYLEKNSDKLNSPAPPDNGISQRGPAVLVKKPGSSTWVVRGAAGCLEVMVPKSPDGCDPKSIEPVFPKP